MAQDSSSLALLNVALCRSQGHLEPPLQAVMGNYHVTMCERCLQIVEIQPLDSLTSTELQLLAKYTSQASSPYLKVCNVIEARQAKCQHTFVVELDSCQKEHTWVRRCCHCMRTTNTIFSPCVVKRHCVRMHFDEASKEWLDTDNKVH